MTGMGQIPLIIGALAILATLQLSVNSAILRSLITTLDSETTIDAISIGQAMIDEIQTKEYDQKSIGKKIYNVNQLTPFSNFGPDSSESVPPFERDSAGIFRSSIRFNDVDDYHKYTRIVSSPRMGDFIVRDSICYAQENNLDLRSNTQTWYKKIIVKVEHKNLLYPIVVKSLVVYRRFI